MLARLHNLQTQGFRLAHSRNSCIRVTGMANLDKVDAKQPVDPEVYASRWEAMWAAGIGKGQKFDCGDASPMLLDSMSSSKLEVRGKRVIVPGCGRGYDLAAFAAAGASEAVGLELSVTAVQEATAYLSEALSGVTEEVKLNSRVVQADFYTFSAEPFDIGYDYTFLCAMHPSQRRDWAATWAGLIKPGGTLATLIYPVDPSRDPDVGPPFPVNPELYQTLLPPAGFKCISIDAVPAELSHEGRAGKEYLGLWERLG